MGQPESDTDRSLTHYGVRGMRWGKRKSASTSSAPSKSKAKAPEHDDSKRTTDLLAKAKGTKGRALSNKELEEVLNRLNLEKRLSDLAPVRDTSAKKMLNRLVGNTQKGAEATGQQMLNAKIADIVKKKAGQ